MKTRSILALSVVIFPGVIISQNRYVSSTGTNTGNDCTLPGNPCAEIGYAITQAADGDSVIISPGTYAEHGIEVNKRVVIRGDSANKPVIRTDTTFAIHISAHHVRLHNLEIRLGLTASDGMTGILADSVFDSLEIVHNHIYSEKPISTGMVFDAYGMHLYGEPGARVYLGNNYAGVLSSANDGFGRALGLGKSMPGMPGGDCPGGMIGGSLNNANEFNGFYPVQAIAPAQSLEFSYNTFTGQFFMNYAAADSILVRYNTFSTGGPVYAPFIPVLLNIAKSSDSTYILVDGNTLEQYLSVGLLSGAAGNVAVTNNNFAPLSTAADYVSLMINTKHSTNGPDPAPPYPALADIRGNVFAASLIPNTGKALVIANHNSGFTQPFGNFTIGGATPQEFNHFDPAIRYYIFLDSNAGTTALIPMWSQYYPTQAQKVSQDFTALEIYNDYGLTDSLLEDRLHHQPDDSGLGFITVTSSTGTGEAESGESPVLFPNPASGMTCLHTGGGMRSFMISDMHGRMVLPCTPVPAGQSLIGIRCEGWVPGIYFVGLEYENGVKYVRLVVIES